MLINEMDEIFGLVIALDRQIIQGNLKQAYSIARTLSIKLGALMDKILLEAMEDESEMINHDKTP